MHIKEALKKAWQVLSFIFVLYGFYLFFLFVWDTMLRISEKLAFPVALLSTVVLMAVSALFWLRKHLKGSSSSAS